MADKKQRRLIEVNVLCMPHREGPALRFHAQIKWKPLANEPKTWVPWFSALTSPDGGPASTEISDAMEYKGTLCQQVSTAIQVLCASNASADPAEATIPIVLTENLMMEIVRFEDDTYTPKTGVMGFMAQVMAIDRVAQTHPWKGKPSAN